MSDYISYENLNLYNSSYSNSTVHCSNTALAQQCSRYLFNKVLGCYDITIPEDWDSTYFRYVLFRRGFIGILDLGSVYGVCPQECNLIDFNLYYMPRKFTVANPLIVQPQTRTIDIDGVVIKFLPDYHGIMDCVTTYADMMALAIEDVGINLLNSKFSYVFAGEGKTESESFKKLYDKIASGEPAAFVEKSLYNEDGTPKWQFFKQDVASSYITDKLLNDLKTIENEFNTIIGIPNANTQKRERLIVDEVNANNIETFTIAKLAEETIKDGMNRANEMFGLNLDIKYKWGDM